MQVETDGEDVTIITETGHKYLLKEEEQTSGLRVLLVPERGAKYLLVQPSSENSIVLRATQFKDLRG